MKPSRTRLKFGLSFSIFVLLLLLFVLPMQKPGSAEWYVTLATLVLDVPFFLFLVGYIRKHRGDPDESEK